MITKHKCNNWRRKKMVFAMQKQQKFLLRTLLFHYNDNNNCSTVQKMIRHEHQIREGGNYHLSNLILSLILAISIHRQSKKRGRNKTKNLFFKSNFLFLFYSPFKLCNRLNLREIGESETKQGIFFWIKEMRQQEPQRKKEDKFW